jgi:hypothetical protein
MSSSSYKESNLALWILGAAALLILIVLGYFFYSANIEREVWFANLKDGSEVESPFRVDMKAKNLVVESAANGVTDGHGHFHILVDTSLPGQDLPIPSDARHIHYGQGDSVAFLDLPVGDHTLTLLFAKGDHIPYQPQIMQEIRIRVTRRNAPVNDLPGEGAAENGAEGITPAEVNSTQTGNGPEGMGIGGGVGVGSGGMGN